MNTNDNAPSGRGAGSPEPSALVTPTSNTNFSHRLDENPTTDGLPMAEGLDEQNVVGRDEYLGKKENTENPRSKEAESKVENSVVEVRKDEVGSEPCSSTTSMAGDRPHLVRIDQNPGNGKENRSRVVPVRLTFSEYGRIKDDAMVHGISVSEFIRRHTLKRKLPSLPASPIDREMYQILCQMSHDTQDIIKALRERDPEDTSIESVERMLDDIHQIGMAVLGSR